MTATTTNVAIYCRAAVGDDLDAQRQRCVHSLHQHPTTWVISPVHYDDADGSGLTTERPALHQLLTDVRDGTVQIVVVTALDRLSRSLTDLHRLLEVFHDHRVDVMTATDHGAVVMPLYRLLQGLSGLRLGLRTRRNG